jgi:EAL domain-containing protein (putative c-di-GMP-specific phosphodiesterase class I)
VIGKLKQLRERGVRISIDDFGTRYSSLNYLRRFPINSIKIDQSFVRDMMEDPGDEAIIRAVINLGRSLGIKVVAEGIESQGQARRLIELACDFGQGFLFSRAVPAGRVPTMVSGCFLQPAVPAAAIRGRDLRLVANRD